MFRDLLSSGSYQKRAGRNQVGTGKARYHRGVPTVPTVPTREEGYTRVRAHARARMSSNLSTGRNGRNHPEKGTLTPSPTHRPVPTLVGTGGPQVGTRVGTAQCA